MSFDPAAVETIAFDSYGTVVDVSAVEIERFKPEAEIYRHVVDRIGSPIEEIASVAAGWWDVPGAIHAGIRGVWIDRQDTLWGPSETAPDLPIDTFGELADGFDG